MQPHEFLTQAREVSVQLHDLATLHKGVPRHPFRGRCGQPHSRLWGNAEATNLLSLPEIDTRSRACVSFLFVNNGRRANRFTRPTRTAMSLPFTSLFVLLHFSRKSRVWLARLYQCNKILLIYWRQCHKYKHTAVLGVIRNDGVEINYE